MLIFETIQLEERHINKTNTRFGFIIIKTNRFSSLFLLLHFKDLSTKLSFVQEILRYQVLREEKNTEIYQIKS